MLKTALHLGADIHLLNVYSLDGAEPPPLEELVETHPKYPDHRGPRKHKREFAKVFCHATNYVGGARTVAAHTGRSVHEIDKAQKELDGNKGDKKPTVVTSSLASIGGGGRTYIGADPALTESRRQTSLLQQLVRNTAQGGEAMSMTSKNPF